MGRNDFSNLGEDIKDYVEHALNSKDFQQLNTDISNTVNAALDEMKQAFTSGYEALSSSGIKKEASGQAGRPQKKPADKDESQAQKKREAFRQYKSPEEGSYKIIRNRSGKFEKVYAGQPNKQADTTSPDCFKGSHPASGTQRQQIALRKKTGKAGGIFLSVLGFTGLLGTAGLGILFLIKELWLAMSFPALLLILSFISLGKGFTKIGRAKRFRIYAGELNEKGYCTIEQMAESVEKKESYVVRDLEKMVRLRFFPQGRLDEEKTCFMIDNKVYNTYLEMKEYQKERLREQELAKQMGISEEIQKILDEGRRYVEQIKKANDAIPGEAFSEKLFRLEAVIREIFDFIEEHPQEKWDIHKFMEYYLPTVLKLVQAYQDFDSQLVKGENITKAKAEIEDTLETINEAFERLLDSMFAEAAMDVSTDITVLETMLAQEGLINDPF